MEKRSRKQQEARESALILFAGLLVAGYFKMDPQLYGMFALGVLGKSAGFMWGNAKEHEAAAKKPAAVTVAP